MKPVGFAGIIKLTTLIICKNWKHFVCVTLVLAVPAALNLFLLDASGSSKLLLSYWYKRVFPDEEGTRLPPPVVSSSTTKDQFHITPAQKIAVSAFSCVVYFVCTPLLTFSVCRACMDMSVLDLKGSAKALRRSARNFFLTIMCLLALIVGMAVALVATVVAAVIVGGDSTAGVVLLIIVFYLVAVPGFVYLAVILSLAETVAILEECWGWEAMRRSMYLVGQQRTGTALALMLLFWACGLLVLLGVASDSRWITVWVGVGAQSLIYLASIVSRVVFYMSCRAGLREPLHSIVAADDQFNSSSQLPTKYLDLETATLATSQI